MGVVGTGNYGPLAVASFEGETKSTPVNEDILIVIDSEDSNKLKKATVASINCSSGIALGNQVNTYADLPSPASSYDTQLWYVKTSTGFLWNQRKGWYESTGGAWVRSSNQTLAVQDNQAKFYDDADTTKIMEMQLSGITTGNTRTITMADRDIDLGSDYVFTAGLAGGQTIIGGTASGEDLTLQSTSNATRGSIFLGSAATSAYDEINDRLGIGIAAAEHKGHFYEATAEIEVRAETNGDANCSLTAENSLRTWEFRNSATTGNLKIVVDGNVALEIEDDVAATKLTIANALVTISEDVSIDGGAIFNESGADVDFRVESDISTHAIFMQGSDSRVGFSTSAPNGTVAVAGSTVLNKNNGNSDTWIKGDTATVIFVDASNDNVRIGGETAISANFDLALIGDGVLCLKETTTPTADTNYGKVYCKNDNKYYFQDGAGAEHQVYPAIQSNITQEINAQTGTTYTVVDADHGKLVTLDNAASITLTVNTGLRSDFACMFLQKGAGQVTFAGTSTRYNRNNFTMSSGQWSFFSITHLGSDVFVTQGDMA